MYKGLRGFKCSESVDVQGCTSTTEWAGTYASGAARAFTYVNRVQWTHRLPYRRVMHRALFLISQLTGSEPDLYCVVQTVQQGTGCHVVRADNCGTAVFSNLHQKQWKQHLPKRHLTNKHIRSVTKTSQPPGCLRDSVKSAFSLYIREIQSHPNEEE